MVVVAQLVRALVCGAGGRGFESIIHPKEKSSEHSEDFFSFIRWNYGIKSARNSSNGNEFSW